MSALLGVKGIILQVETSIKAQQQPQDVDTHEACFVAVVKKKDCNIPHANSRLSF